MINDAVQIISTVGFPIACALGLAAYAYKTTDRIIALTERVTDALVQSTDAINDNVKALEDIKNVITFLAKKED